MSWKMKGKYARDSVIDNLVGVDKAIDKQSLERTVKIFIMTDDTTGVTPWKGLWKLLNETPYWRSVLDINHHNHNAPREPRKFCTCGSTELRWSNNADGFMHDLQTINFNYIQSISFWHCISSQPDRATTQLATLIRSCPALNSFTVQGNVSQFMLQDSTHACVVLEALVESPNLKYVALTCRADADTHVGKQLGLLTPKLVRLNLETMNFQDPFALQRWAESGLQTAPRLTSLNLAGCSINDEGLAILACALPASLSTLRMEQNHLTKASLPALGKLLQDHSSLVFLNLGHQDLFKISDENKENDQVLLQHLLLPFLEGIKKNKKLRELSLQNTGMTNETLLELVQALVFNVCLEDLNLFQNPISFPPNSNTAQNVQAALSQNTKLLHIRPAGLCNGHILKRNLAFKSMRYLEGAAPIGIWPHWLEHLHRRVGPSAMYCSIGRKIPDLLELSNAMQQQKEKTARISKVTPTTRILQRPGFSVLQKRR